MTQVPVPARRGGDLPTRLLQPVLMLAAMWGIRWLDVLMPGDWNRQFGLVSWSISDLDGVLLAPMLHANAAHLVSNSVPFLFLGLLVALDGVGCFWAVTGIAAVVGGLGTWVVNVPGTVTVGASGLVFGYFGYLLIRAFVARSLGHGLLYALVAVVIVALYGGTMATGILGAPEGISWQAHLFGAVGGGVAAVATRPRRTLAPRP